MSPWGLIFSDWPSVGSETRVAQPESSLAGMLLEKPARPMGGKAVLLLGHAVNTVWEQSALEQVVNEARIPLNLFQIIFM